MATVTKNDDQPKDSQTDEVDDKQDSGAVSTNIPESNGDDGLNENDATINGETNNEESDTKGDIGNTGELENTQNRTTEEINNEIKTNNENDSETQTRVVQQPGIGTEDSSPGPDVVELVKIRDVA